MAVSRPRYIIMRRALWTGHTGHIIQSDGDLRLIRIEAGDPWAGGQVWVHWRDLAEVIDA